MLRDVASWGLSSWAERSESARVQAIMTDNFMAYVGTSACRVLFLVI